MAPARVEPADGAFSERDTVLQLQQQVGNQSVQSLFRSGAIRAKLAISSPDDPEEREADHLAQSIMRSPAGFPARSHCSCADSEEMCEECKQKQGGISMQRSAAGPAAPAQATRLVHEVLRSSGWPLDHATRAFFEPRFGHDFSKVRVHTGTAAAQSAQSINAQAYTVGTDIVFGAGQYSPDSTTGRTLLAHELTHVLQTENGRSQIRRDGDPNAQKGSQPTAGGTAQAPSFHEHSVPLDWVKKPGSSDILAVLSGKQMVALPAAGAFVLIQPPSGAILPDEPLFTVPTVAKEGLVAINVGNSTGFLVDAGGQPAVVFPQALAEIQGALGITSIRGIVVTHIHEDHVRSFVGLVRTNSITPENLHFPAAFAVNPSAPSSTFAQALQAIQSDPQLQALGHGRQAAYSVIPVPQGGAFFQRTLTEGNVRFDFYGLTQEFRNLQASRAAGREPRNADTASLLTCITYTPTQFRVLYVGDLRGSDLTLFRQAMGDSNYNEMLRGVSVIDGLQHHMGALESPADRSGLVDLLTRTYLQTGELSVVVQSQETFGGKQFLNRSLIEALNRAGIDVHVAMTPGRGGQVGTITGTAQGRISHSGGGQTEQHLGSEELQSEVRRLVRLREVEDALTKYEKYLTPPGRKSADLRQARSTLEGRLRDYLEVLIGNTMTGAQRGQPTLRDANAVRNSLQQVKAPLPAEDLLTPANMDVVRELQRIGPARDIYEEELVKARETGTMSERGIEALWEFEPKLAQRLVSSSGLPRSTQRQIMGGLPGQPIPAGTRMVAGALLVITVVEEIAPLVQVARANAFSDNVAPALRNIMWWQSKGVYPKMEGVNDRWWPRSNEWTTSPSRIQELLNSDDLDYLSLTSIDDSYWDNFTIWASSTLKNIRDWSHFITEDYSTDDTAVKETGYQEWAYRTEKISGTTFGFKVTQTWQPSERLSRIMNSAYDRVSTKSEELIAAVSKGPIAPDPMMYVAQGTYVSPGIFHGKPQAVGKKKFKQGIEPRLYTCAKQNKRTGYSKEMVFYEFPPSASPNPVPDEYVVVGGADMISYEYIYLTQNLVTSGGDSYAAPYQPNTFEVLLAKKEDLEPIP